MNSLLVRHRDFRLLYIGTRESATAGAIQIAGKFDQYNRELPFLAFLRAFSQLARQMLTESEERLAVWRQELNAALAPNAGLLTGLVPEFAAVLGETRGAPGNAASRPVLSESSAEAEPCAISHRSQPPQPPS